MSENLQEKQPQQNNGKRLLGVILIALAWVVFVFGLLMCSSKCAKATDYKNTNLLTNTSFTNAWYVYSDGTDYYYSQGSRQQKLDFSTYIVGKTNITWTGTRPATGNSIWTDGTHMYYAEGALTGKNYILDFSTYTSTQITITGTNILNNFNVYQLNGSTYYYDSNSNTTCLWNYSNYSCSTYTWAGTYQPQYVWTDGTDYYSSNNSNQYIYDSNTSTWQLMTWTGVYPTTGTSVINAFGNTYLLPSSSSGDIYKLDTSNYTWVVDTDLSNLFVQKDFNHIIPIGNKLCGLPASATMLCYEVDSSYTQVDLDQAYSDGQLNALNTASSATYGSGTTYSSYSSVNMQAEVNGAYSSGYLDGVQDGEDNVLDNPNSYDLYTETQYNNYGTIQYNAGVSQGHLEVVNYVSDRYGSGTVYTIPTMGIYQNTINREIDYYYRSSVWNDAQLDLLNYASGHNGSGTVYSSYSLVSYDNELALIYSNGGEAQADVSYSGGYTAGVNSVLDNLTYYNLYSQSDYDSYGASRYSSGYSAGYTAGNQNEDNSLPKVIVSIASVPYTVLSSMFNFNVLGLNIFVFVTSLISLVVVIWVIKKIWK